MFFPKGFLSVIVVASLPAACAARNTGSLGQDASGAEDVAGTESDAESLGSSLVSKSGQSLATSSFDATGDLRLEGAGAGITVGNPGFWFQPAGCLQVTVTAQQATYAFNGCTGPLGLVELTGTINVTWQANPPAGTLSIDYTAQDFKVNRATIESWQAHAVVAASGNAREMTWNATLTGTTGRGRAFERTNQKDLKWTVGEPCLSVSGQSTGTILHARIQTTVTSFQRCADSCPQAGSEIQVQNLDNGDSIDIQYQGGARAQLTLDGKAYEIGLACGG